MFSINQQNRELYSLLGLVTLLSLATAKWLPIRIQTLRNSLVQNLQLEGLLVVINTIDTSERKGYITELFEELSQDVVLALRILSLEGGTFPKGNSQKLRNKLCLLSVRW